MASTKERRRAREDGLAAGLRAFFAIADRWGLTAEEAMTVLGRPGKTTFYAWKKGEIGQGSRGHDLASRVSYVLGIFKSLEILYQRPEQADGWVRKPNAAFGGQSALQRMLAGQIVDLAAVRDYLDSARAGW